MKLSKLTDIPAGTYPSTQLVIRSSLMWVTINNVKYKLPKSQSISHIADGLYTAAISISHNSKGTISIVILPNATPHELVGTKWLLNGTTIQVTITNVSTMGNVTAIQFNDNILSEAQFNELYTRIPDAWYYNIPPEGILVEYNQTIYHMESFDPATNNLVVKGSNGKFGKNADYCNPVSCNDIKQLLKDN